jgi:hypothetical protein
MTTSDELTEPAPPTTPTAPAPSRTLRWGRRLGMAAFLFFFIKGLAWLIVPALIAAWALRD